jgi:hypothetical protein
MRVTMMPGQQSITGIRIFPVRYEIISGPIAVGLALVVILVPIPNQTYMVSMRNSSPGANIIRVGIAPSFALGAMSGMLINGGDLIMIDYFAGTLNAISDLAGGVLEVGIWGT